MTSKTTIASIPKLAELREAVLAHSEKRKPKWGFRIADDTVMELQPQPCTLLSPLLTARGCKQAVLRFEGQAVTTAGASKADLKRHPQRVPFWTRKFSLVQFAGEPDWQLSMFTGWKHKDADPGGWNSLDAAILAALQGDGIFARLTPERMLSPGCMICGKPLTDPVSMARWIGPECAATTSIRVFRGSVKPGVDALPASGRGAA